MVDICKFLPPVLPSFHSNIPRIRNKSSCQQMFIPLIFSSNNYIPQNDRTNIINKTKRWIGRCPGDPPRHINISDLPYNLHRKVINHELSRYITTTTVDASPSIKIKEQKNSNREPLKATTVTSNSILSNSHLFNALSKHVTIKSEPLRPVNNFLNNTVSSWQTYWTSIQTQRQRKESNDSESILYRPKRDQSCLTTTHFVTIRNSSFDIRTENNSNNSTPSSCTPIKPLSPIIFNKQSSIIKEKDKFILPIEQTSSMNLFKSNEDQFLSTIPNENTIINDDHEINTITRKFYKLPLPSNKPISKKVSRSKSLEKKVIVEKKETIIVLPNTSLPRQRHQTVSNKSHQSTTTIKKQQQQQQQQALSTVITTTPRSKYEQTKWDEPYVGVRFDPPTPPPSPSLFIWPQDSSEQDENDTPCE